MNEKDKQRKRNDIRRLFRHQSGIHTNCIRLNPSNTWEHELLKVKKCWSLLKEKKQFITEAETEDKKQRADIVILDDGLIVECVMTEGEASLAKKAKNYPLPIAILRWGPAATPESAELPEQKKKEA